MRNFRLSRHRLSWQPLIIHGRVFHHPILILILTLILVVRLRRSGAISGVLRQKKKVSDVSFCSCFQKFTRQKSDDELTGPATEALHLSARQAAVTSPQSPEKRHRSPPLTCRRKRCPSCRGRSRCRQSCCRNRTCQCPRAKRPRSCGDWQHRHGSR